MLITKRTKRKNPRETKTSRVDSATENFEHGEQYMLWKLQKYLEGAVDNIQIAVRTLNFIRKEVDTYERKNRNNYSSKTI